MTTDMKIKVTAETEGIDEATDEIHELSDALMEFPPNVMIKNCNYCTFNIYPSQTQFVESKVEDEPTGYNLTPVEDEPQTDCDDRYAVRNDSGEVVAYACPLDCEQTDCAWK